MKYFKLKFLLLFFALAATLPSAWAANVTDELTASNLGVTGSSYATFSGVTGASGAVYAGKYANNNGVIQMNYATSGGAQNSGIVSTTSGGTVKSITLTVNSSLQTNTRTVVIYGKNTDYTSASDLYDKSTRGTELLRISTFYSGEKYTITGDYTSIGIVSAGNAIYLDKIEIEWATPEDYEAEVAPTALNLGKTAPNTSVTQNVTVKNTGLLSITPTVSVSGTAFSTTYAPTAIAKGETATIPVVFAPTATGNFEGTLHIGAQESDATDLDVTLTGIAAYELTVCNNNEETGYLPVWGYNHDSFNQINQMIYPSTMLESIEGKKITSMTYYLKSGLKF